jgi:hypothetical protein
MADKTCVVCGDKVPWSAAMPDGSLYVCPKIQCHIAMDIGKVGLKGEKGPGPCPSGDPELDRQNRINTRVDRAADTVREQIREEKGLRYNKDKTRWSLVPFEVLAEIADHYTRGAKKYEDENWRKGLSFNDTFDCAMRHIHAWKMGEEYDEETGSRHLIAAIWNLMALVYFCMYPTGYGRFDDRYPNEAHVWYDEATPFGPEQMEAAIKFSEEYKSTRVDTNLTGHGPNRRISGDRRKRDRPDLGMEQRSGKERRITKHD